MGVPSGADARTLHAEGCVFQTDHSPFARSSAAFDTLDLRIRPLELRIL